VPLLWLAARTSPDSKVWVFVLEAGSPVRPLVGVETDYQRGKVIVHVGGTLVISAQKVSDESAAVESLDLRPLGLIVFGNARELHIGGMTMERNTLANLGTAFAMG